MLRAKSSLWNKDLLKTLCTHVSGSKGKVCKAGGRHRGNRLAGTMTVQGQVPMGELLSSSGGPIALQTLGRHERDGTSQGAEEKIIVSMECWPCLALH